MVETVLERNTFCVTTTDAEVTTSTITSDTISPMSAPAQIAPSVSSAVKLTASSATIDQTMIASPLLLQHDDAV